MPRKPLKCLKLLQRELLLRQGEVELVGPLIDHGLLRSAIFKDLAENIQVEIQEAEDQTFLECLAAYARHSR